MATGTIPCLTSQKSLCDGVVGRRAGARDRECRTGDAEFDRQVAGRGAHHQARDHRWPHPGISLPVKLAEGLIVGGFSACSRTEDHCRPPAQLVAQLQPGVIQRFPSSQQRKLGEAVHQAQALSVEVAAGIVVPHLGAHPDAKIFGRQDRKRAYGRAPGPYAFPERPASQAHGRDAAKSGDGDAVHPS